MSRDVQHTGLKEFVKEEKKVVLTDDGETEEYSGPSRAQWKIEGTLSNAEWIVLEER